MDTVKQEKQKLKRIQQFVKKRYDNYGKSDLEFFSYVSCKKLVKSAHVIAGTYKLEEDDQFVLNTAAWLMQIVYLENFGKQGTEGTILIQDFLRQLMLDDDLINRVTYLVSFNNGIAHPDNILEEIFSDAVTYSFGKKAFLRFNELQRKELSVLGFCKISKKDWATQSIDKIQNHRYYTEIARTLLENKKQRNLTMLKCQHFESNYEIQNHSHRNSEARFAALKASKEFSEKGTDTMFRIALVNNQRISALGDNKARILITVNSIILSAIISLVLKNLHKEEYLAYPTFTMVAVSLITITLAILAIRPHISSGRFTRAELENNEANLLFYGAFYKMSLSEFKNSMFEVMKYKDLLYGTLIQDHYEQGKAIGRKYYLLRTAYTIFMFGLILSMVAFIASTINHYHSYSFLTLQSIVSDFEIAKY